MGRLLKGTFIYGSGQVLSRLITFLLLPLTTAYITPEDYGVLGVLGIVTMCLSGLFTLGLGVSLARCYWSTEIPKERTGIIWTGMATLLTHASFILLLSYFFLVPLCNFALLPLAYKNLLLISLGSLALSAISLPLATYFRLHERALLVVSCSLVELAISLSTSLYLVIIAKQGCSGIVIGTFAGQLCSILLMTILALKEIPFGFAWRFLPDMIKIGYPYMFGLAGYFLLQSSSRYILEEMESIEALGLFFLGSNFGRTIELLVASFISAWSPYMLSFINNTEEAAVVFSKVLRYYVIGMCAILACYFSLAKPLVMLMVQPLYFNVWTVVGIVAIAQALWGLYGISATGFIFHKKSIMQMLTEISAGLSSIVFCYLLIPNFHIEGAAVAMLLGFTTLLLISFPLNLRLLPVKYQFKPLIKVVAGLFIVAVISFLPINNLALYSSITTGATFFYLAFLWFVCLHQDEKDKVRTMVFPIKGIA